MGQYLSAIRKFRVIHKDAQQSHDLRESFEQGLSPHDESAASLLNSKDDLPSNFSEAALEDSQISLSPEREKVPINLTELPTEIILDVAGQMAPSGQLSLSYSCRHMRKKMGASLIDIINRRTDGLVVTLGAACRVTKHTVVGTSGATKYVGSRW